MQGRNAQTRRQWRIFHLLWYTRTALTAESLKAALGTELHIKTIKRDMLAVAEGFPATNLETREGRLLIRLDRAVLETMLSDKPEIRGKYCTGCNKVKSLEDFHNCRSYPDGKWFECKTCRNSYNKMYYDANYRRDRVIVRGTDGRYLKTTGQRRRRKLELGRTS